MKRSEMLQLLYGKWNSYAHHFAIVEFELVGEPQ
jgi:hypothetical protein